VARHVRLTQINGDMRSRANQADNQSHRCLMMHSVDFRDGTLAVFFPFDCRLQAREDSRETRAAWFKREARWNWPSLEGGTVEMLRSGTSGETRVEDGHLATVSRNRSVEGDLRKPYCTMNETKDRRRMDCRECRAGMATQFFAEVIFACSTPSCAFSQINNKHWKSRQYL
jgi:hypothetical protein